MITRRNWLLRCSILINIAVLLYICSHVMIGSGNISLGPSYVIQEDYSAKQQPTHLQAVVANLQSAGGGGGGVEVESVSLSFLFVYLLIINKQLIQKYEILLKKKNLFLLLNIWEVLSILNQEDYMY